MATAAPPVLSSLAGMLLQRPPLLQELIVRLSCAEDYAWFAELVCRLFPQEADRLLAIPDAGSRLAQFAQLFEEQHFCSSNSSWAPWLTP